MHLNWLDISSNGIYGTLQPRALGFLNHVDPMDSMSNLYVELFLTKTTDNRVSMLKLKAKCIFVGTITSLELTCT